MSISCAECGCRLVPNADMWVWSADGEHFCSETCRYNFCAERDDE